MELATRVYGALQATRRDALRRAQAALGEARAAFRHKRYEREYGDSAPDPYRLIHIDPTEVDHLLEPRFDARLSDHGTYILGGEWDRTEASEGLMYANLYEDVFDEPTLVRFDQVGFYRSAKERFEQGVPWESTEFYRWCIERIEADEHRSPRFASEADVEERLAVFDALYEEIEAKGYRTQRELRAADDVPYHKTVWPPERHEVKVSIGREGEIVFDEGQHRFVVAKLLGIPEIPVRVIVRHRAWQDKRAIVHDHARSGVEPVDTDPLVSLDHPDLVDVVEDAGTT